MSSKNQRISFSQLVDSGLDNAMADGMSSGDNNGSDQGQKDARYAYYCTVHDDSPGYTIQDLLNMSRGRKSIPGDFGNYMLL